MNENFAQMVAAHLTTQDSKEERAHERLWVGRILVLLTLLVTTVYYTGAYAGPIARTEGMNEMGMPLSVTIYSEPCPMPDKVKNLPARATLYINEKVIEGCAGRNDEYGLVVFYFDGVVELLPVQVFMPVTGV